MQFNSLRLKNFRNYADLHLEIPPGVVVFYGPNGQGKTNLMEAFYFLLRGNSFRPLSSDSVFKYETEAARLDARLTQGDLTYDLKMQLLPGKRSTQLNGNPVNAAMLTRQFPVVLFSPESLMAIKEGPEERRQLLDEVLLTHSAANVKILKDFQKALKFRNRLLKNFKRGLTGKMQTLQLLESIDPSYIPLATSLTVARIKALQALQDDFHRAVNYVLDAASVDISVEYVISGENAYSWTRDDLLSAMHNRALELREAELAGGQSLVGPQRHDIRILFTGKDSRFFCSQGQQRAIILSFKMAQILYHYRAYQVYPFLLLDDVLSELDPIRRSNLVSFLRDIPAQIFLTTTDLSYSLDFGDRGINVFRIENGLVGKP